MNSEEVSLNITKTFSIIPIVLCHPTRECQESNILNLETVLHSDLDVVCFAEVPYCRFLTFFDE